MIAVADMPLESQSLESEHILKIRFKNAQNSWTAPTQAPKPADTKQMIHFAVLNGECLLLNNDIMCPAQLLWCRDVKKKEKKRLCQLNDTLKFLWSVPLNFPQNKMSEKWNIFCAQTLSQTSCPCFSVERAMTASAVHVHDRKKCRLFSRIVPKKTNQQRKSTALSWPTVQHWTVALCHKYVNNFLSRDREH